jgi:hypothetical protein
MLSGYFARRAAFNFASLIARTFFMIRRRVALSAALSVVLAIAEILLMEFAKSNFYFRAIIKSQDLSRIRLRQKNRVGSLDRFTDARYFVNDCLQIIYDIPDGVENLDNQNNGVYDGDGEPDARRRLRDLRCASELELGRERFEEVEDRTPRGKESLDEFFDLCDCSFNVDNSLPEPEVFSEVFEGIDLRLDRIK